MNSALNKDVRVCSRCVMDTTDPLIQFDEQGVCNYCKLQDILEKRYTLNEERREEIASIVETVKKAGKGKKYDCIIGVSGGTDSTYQLYLAKQLHLRPLVVHLDNGWNSDIAVSNIEKATKIYGFDLHTYVLDWEEFKDLQLAFLKASTPDCEIPTDIAIQGTLYRVAAEEGIKYIMKGHSFRTEGRVPLMWSYGDGRYIKSVHKRFGKNKLRTFPNLTISQMFFYSYIKGIKQIRLLYYFPYNKEEIKQLLKGEIGWEDYGGHHYESIYTRFYQGYILPRKFGIDKRKREFSALIRSGQMLRGDALDILRSNEPLSNEQVASDKRYVVEKLGISTSEFDGIMNLSPKTFFDYPTYFPVINKMKRVIEFLFKFISTTTPLILYEPNIEEIKKKLSKQMKLG